MDNKLFYCYSPILKRALLHNGFRYLHVGINNNTNRYFWVFNNTTELDEYFHLKYQLERDSFK